jgi:hypothetical protein
MNKTVAGIVRQKWSPIESRFYFESLNFYDEVIYIDPRQVTYILDREKNKINILLNGVSLNHLSMLYTFGYAGTTLLLAKYLGMCGCPTSDPYNMISRDSLGKLTDLLTLHNAGVGTSAHILPSLDAATRYIDGLDQEIYPLIRKPVAGNRGRGIRKLENREEAIKACHKHFAKSEDVLLLEKYMNFQNEYRVYFIDGTPIEAYERVKVEGRVASNIYQGGSILTVDPDVKQRLFDHVSACVLDNFKTGIYGLDLGVTDTGSMHVIEVNRTPGFGGLKRLKLTNFPRRAHEIIRRRARVPDSNSNDDSDEYILTLLGDTNPGHSYQDRLEQKGKLTPLKQNGYDHSFEKFRDVLFDSNFTLANLEVCLTERRESTLAGRKSYLDHADTKETTQLLHSLGVTAVSLANNHSMDFGEEGLIDTLDALKAMGIASFGAGRTALDAQSVLHHRLTLGGEQVHVAFLGGYELKTNYRSWGYYADANSGGVNLWTEENARQQIEIFRRDYPNTYLIACPHWGSSYEHVTDAQQKLAEVLIDAGADLLIGHGSHMLQHIRKYKNKWIIFSLGNFVYNSPGRFKKFDIKPYSLIGRLRLRLQNGHVNRTLNLYPIQSDNRRTGYQSDFVSEAEFDKVMRFYMPTTSPRNGIQSCVITGKDKFGYYFSINL